MPVLPMLEVFMKRMTCAHGELSPAAHKQTHKITREHSQYLASCQVELNNDVVVSGGACGYGAEQITAWCALQIAHKRGGWVMRWSGKSHHLWWKS